MITKINPAGDSASTNRLVKVIQDYYTVKPYYKSEDQIESEKWLIPNCILFQRWFALPAAFIVQCCNGSMYGWSIYNKPIDLLIYGDSSASMAPITFYITIAFFGIAAAIVGPALETHGPKKTCLIGAIIFLCGNLLTALGLSLKIIWLVYLGYGCFVGMGTAIAYISPVSSLQKWFPDRRGFASGFATCGFGAGAVIFSKLQLPILNAVGLPLNFVVFGGIFICLQGVAAMVLRTPPPDFRVVETVKGSPTISESTECPETSVRMSTLEPVKNEMTLVEAITSKEFKIMMVMFISGISFIIVLSARLSNIVTDIFGKTPELAATVVAVDGGMDFVGKVLFSFISDFIGRKNCVFVLLSLQLLVVGLFSTMTNYGAFEIFWVSVNIATAAAGASFGIIPAFLTDKFGPSNTGACHGIMLSGWSFAAVAEGLIFTVIFNSLISSGYAITDPFIYNVNAWWLFALTFIGWTLLYLVPPTPSDTRFYKSVKRIFSCKRFSYKL